MGIRPSKWSNEISWRVNKTASYTAPAVIIVGLGFNLVGSVASAREKPNNVFLDWFEILGWLLILVGVVLFVYMFLTRDAENPRPFTVRFRLPHKPHSEHLEGGAWGRDALVLPQVWIANESDETLSLEFILHCDDKAYGMRPYRDFYNEHRSALRDKYLSNPRHLGPRQQAERRLPFMSDETNFSYRRYESFVLEVRISPPGISHMISIPTPEEGEVVPGMVNSRSVGRTRESPTGTTV